MNPSDPNNPTSGRFNFRAANQRPADPTQRPADPTQRPGVPTQRPADPTQRPGVPTQRPGVPTQRPGVSIQRPAAFTRSPAAFSRSPAASSRSPAFPTVSGMLMLRVYFTLLAAAALASCGYWMVQLCWRFCSPRFWEFVMCALP